MSRSNCRSKGAGYEWWNKRPMAGASPSALNKRICNQIERARTKREVERAKSELS